MIKLNTVIQAAIFIALVAALYTWFNVGQVVAGSLASVMMIVFYSLGGEDTKRRQLTDTERRERVETRVVTLAYSGVVGIVYVVLRVSIAHDKLSTAAVVLFLAEIVIGVIASRNIDKIIRKPKRS